MTDDSLLKSRIPLPAALAAACVLAAGTFTLAVYFNSTQVETLKVQRDDALARLDQRAADSNTVPPSATLAASEQPQEVAELSAKLEAVEQEKQVLVAQIAELSRDALDPRSEIGILVQQLQSGNEAQRMAAATGLFAIRDTRTVQPLIDYYWKDTSEATRVELAHRYIRHALWDRRVGVDFVIRVLESDNELNSTQAFDVLTDLAMPASEEPDDFDAVVRPTVESLALSSKDPLVRTRAKVILERRKEWEAQMKEIFGDDWPDELAERQRRK